MQLKPSLAILFAAGTLAAQTLHHAPNAHATLEGGSNNTIPWWSQSGTYQQVHDASDLAAVFGSPVAVINSIHLRKDGFSGGTVAARTLDLEINLGHTTISAAAPSTTFATNLGSSPANVLPYTTISLPALSNTSLPNPAGWSFPFATPFTYVSATGNLCWEFRHRNASVTSAVLDAVSINNLTSFPAFGGGCIATGQTQAASISTRSLALNTGNYRNLLARGAASAPAALLLGGARQQITIPGLCAALEFLPLVDLPGGTDGAGSWDLTIPLGSLVGSPSATLISQFVFVDAGLGLGIGVSDAWQVTTPPLSINNVARIWYAPSGGTTGFELGTTGTTGSSYGLVTIFGT